MKDQMTWQKWFSQMEELIMFCWQGRPATAQFFAPCIDVWPTMDLSWMICYQNWKRNAYWKMTWVVADVLPLDMVTWEETYLRLFAPLINQPWESVSNLQNTIVWQESLDQLFLEFPNALPPIAEVCIRKTSGSWPQTRRLHGRPLNTKKRIGNGCPHNS